MKQYGVGIFDLDGTLYRGAEPIPFAVETLTTLKSQGMRTIYLTNNSSQTREFYRQKLTAMGFQVEPNEIYSSALGSALHLLAIKKQSAFVVGMPGLIQTLSEGGIHVVNTDQNGHASPQGSQAQSVVVGICQEFNYALMAAAMDQIKGGAQFLATNTDATFPLEGGRLTPGAGSIVAAIRTCSETEPFVVGKPNRYLIDLVLEEHGYSASDALVVGDRLDTDIAAGKNAGCDTFLVLTGVERSAPPGQRSGIDLRDLLKP